MTEKSSSEARPLIGFINRDNAPQISPAPISRTWMSEMAATADVAAGGRVERQGDYTRGRHRDGEAGAADHQTRRHLRSFQQGSE